MIHTINDIFASVVKFFSVKPFYAKRGTPDYARAVHNITELNIQRIFPLSILLMLSQVVYVISDLTTSYYERLGGLKYLNITAEGLMFFGSFAFCLISFRFVHSERKNFRLARIAYRLFYAIMSLAFLLFIISDSLSYSPATSIYLFLMILGVVPVLSSAEACFYYGISAVVIFVMLFAFADMAPAEKTQTVIILLSSCLVSAYLRVSRLKVIFSELELKRLNKKLDTLSSTDPLTELPNRRALAEFVTSSMPQWAKEKKKVAFSICDIDYFKAYNDVNSHLAGDSALIALGAFLKEKCVSPQSMAARIGGEEFIIIYSTSGARGEIEEFFSGLRRGVENLAILDNYHASLPPITISLGVCIFEASENVNISNVYEAADRELYKVKDRSRNNISICG